MQHIYLSIHVYYDTNSEKIYTSYADLTIKCSINSHIDKLLQPHKNVTISRLV